MTFWLWLISTADFLHFLSCPVVSNFSRSSGLQHPEGVPVYLALRLYGGGKSKKAATQVPPDKGLQDLLANSSEAGPFHQLLGCLIINTKVDDHFSDKRPFNEQAPYFLRRLLGKPHKRKGFAPGTQTDQRPASNWRTGQRGGWKENLGPLIWFHPKYVCVCHNPGAVVFTSKWLKRSVLTRPQIASNWNVINIFSTASGT